MNNFIPTTLSEMNCQADFIIISGDAYVDHPSFGHALIARLIQSQGYSVAIIAQPINDSDYIKLGEPKYAFMVASGVCDSMVNNYTVSKIKRTQDVYSPSGKLNRPDRATIYYSNKLKKLFPESFVIVGGIEASLRRSAHYDYWADKVMPSILVDSKADLLVYGMGEKPIIDLISELNKGIPINRINYIDGTAYLTKNIDNVIDKSVKLASFKQVQSDKKAYAANFNIEYNNTDHINGSRLIQEQDTDVFLVVNPPSQPLTQQQMDTVYSLPFTKQWHPSYDSIGGIKALSEVKFSITSHRGCLGGCNFCALNYHQGRIISSRSKNSIVDEAIKLTKMTDFNGYINDIGGPTANFYMAGCDKATKSGVCLNKQCVGTSVCNNLKVNHKEYLDVLTQVRQLPNIKKVFVRSGVRFDYVMNESNDYFLTELIKHHVSGQLKVAPEHISDNVLRCMNKPSSSVYKSFVVKFYSINAKLQLKQYIVPYFISSHPSSTINDAVELACYLKSINYMPLQVQDFYPTPSTMSTTMYYTELDPRTLTKVYVAKTKEEKALQRALLQYRKKENYHKVADALKLANRLDLIGYSDKCLIKPQQTNTAKPSTSKISPYKLNKKK